MEIRNLKNCQVRIALCFPCNTKCQSIILLDCEKAFVPKPRTSPPLAGICWHSAVPCRPLFHQQLPHLHQHLWWPSPEPPSWPPLLYWNPSAPLHCLSALCPVRQDTTVNCRTGTLRAITPSTRLAQTGIYDQQKWLATNADQCLLLW